MDEPKVLLMQPPIYDFALYDLFFKPYGLLRIGKWLQQNGYGISYLNALDWHDRASISALGRVRRSAHGTGKFFRVPADLPAHIPPIRKQYSRYGILPQSICAALKESRPDLVFITTGMTYWYEGVTEAVALVREQAPEAKVLLGGIYATLMAEHALQVTGADAVITGDGRQQLQEVLGSWGFPVPDGPIPLQPLLLDAAWEDAAGVLRLNTGCPLHCDYCASDLITPVFQRGDPYEGFEMLMELRRRFGIRHVGFYDDALLMHSDRVFKPFLELVIRSGVDWKFYTPNAVHIKLIDREVAELMSRSGFQEVRMGYESSSTEFHEAHDHKFDHGDLQRAVSLLKGAGFTRGSLPVYILAGLPGQSMRDVMGSVNAAGRAGLSVSIAEFSPVPGTPAWELACEQSRYPIRTEPLFHNNSFQVTAWDGLTREDMQQLKLAARATRSQR